MTCDTTVEITETLANLMSLTLEGWAIMLPDPRDQRFVRGPDVSERRMPALVAHEALAITDRACVQRERHTATLAEAPFGLLSTC